MSGATVLLVDDDPQLVRVLGIALRGHGYRVVSADNAGSAVKSAHSAGPDLVLLDLGLPDGDGTTVISALRTWTDIPIIIMSGRSGTSDKIDALDLGADDYVVKPFRTDELLARIRAHLRRTRSAEPVRIGATTVNLATRTATADGEPLRLTPTEWHLLERLLAHPDKLVTPRELLAGLRTEPDQPSSYLRVYMSQLRHKLELDPRRPRHLLTEPGLGYRYKP